MTDIKIQTLRIGKSDCFPVDRIYISDNILKVHKPAISNSAEKSEHTQPDWFLSLSMFICLHLSYCTKYTDPVQKSGHQTDHPP